MHTAKDLSAQQKAQNHWTHFGICQRTFRRLVRTPEAKPPIRVERKEVPSHPSRRQVESRVAPHRSLPTVTFNSRLSLAPKRVNDFLQFHHHRGSRSSRPQAAAAPVTDLGGRTGGGSREMEALPGFWRGLRSGFEGLCGSEGGLRGRGGGDGRDRGGFGAGAAAAAVC